ncbi:PfkB family carbohydrate kinase [Streptomyces sp. NBC_00829]|uniref:PfkB family carbohydrate kinase n=1 Tax=Streptomyces sp. NBC_00829 TaxID=2903679 RepID=UPI00386B7189
MTSPRSDGFSGTRQVVEPTGAGDAFAAGYLAATLRGLDQRSRLRLGHLTAATALITHGDHGTPPSADLAAALLSASLTNGPRPGSASAQATRLP